MIIKYVGPGHLLGMSSVTQSHAISVVGAFYYQRQWTLWATHYHGAMPQSFEEEDEAVMEKIVKTWKSSSFSISLNPDLC